MEVGFNIWVIIACSILLCCCIYLELKRENKHWLAARIISNFLLASSFALMVIPIFYEHKEVQIKNTLTVITTGANLDSLSKIQGKKYYTDPSLHQLLKGKANYLPDLSYHLAENPAINSLQVYGYGLLTEDLEKLKHIPLSFHPAAAPNGVIACNWNGSLKQEELLSVQGSYQNKASKAVLLKLEGFGTTLDSVSIAANARQEFTLQHQVRQNGKALLQLIGLAGKDTVSKETLPIQSFAKGSDVLLKILISSCLCK